LQAVLGDEDGDFGRGGVVEVRRHGRLLGVKPAA
jgi:hypothetical protein